LTFVAEISVNRLQLGGDSLLCAGIYCKSLASPVIFKRSKEMEIMRHKIMTVRRVAHVKPHSLSAMMSHKPGWQ